MNLEHDPIRQVSYLQQCLSQDKKPLGLFLGAGCPLSIKTGNGEKSQPLIPDVAGITQAVCQNLASHKECKNLLKLVQDHFTKDGRENPNVEDILSHIRGLRAVAGKDMIRGLTAEDLDRLDMEICRVIQGLADKPLPSSDTPYHRVAAWIDATPRDIPVQVFTTNYDLSMEQAFEDLHVPYFDGFAGARKPFFDLRSMEENQLPSRWARLWKLHGSINWYQDVVKGVYRGSTKEQGSKRVIHPSHLKYDESRRMPYLAMIDRLRAFLKQPSTALVLCGYSFRDDHINEIIVQGLQGNQTATAFALLYGNIEPYAKAITLALDRPNLTLLAKNTAAIGSRLAAWAEKDAESVPTTDYPWIKWIPANQKENKNKCSPEFSLGDFVVFGAFLHELVGQVRQQTEATNAK
jgi:hypothetical protein